LRWPTIFAELSQVRFEEVWYGMAKHSREGVKSGTPTTNAKFTLIPRDSLFEKRPVLEDCIMNIESRRLRREPDEVIAQHNHW
jgi:hypothetical protein